VMLLSVFFLHAFEKKMNADNSSRRKRFFMICSLMKNLESSSYSWNKIMKNSDIP